jgi:prepilin peptidase CpaA
MGAQILVMLVLPALLVAAAGWDLASFTIPNFLQIGLAAAFLLFVAAIHMTLPSLAWHLTAGLLGFCAGFALFALWILVVV